MIKPALLLTVAALALAGCGSDRGQNVVTPAQSPSGEELQSITCTVSYRKGPRARGREETLTVQALQNQGLQRDSVRFGELAVRIRYFDDSYESPVFNVIVRSPGHDEDLTARLYQFQRVGGQGGPDTQGGPAAKPENEFVGGHGFTGLGYVFDPDSRAEMQYFCEAD